MTVNILVIVLIIERKRSDNLQTIATLNLTHVHMLCSTHMMLTVVLTEKKTQAETDTLSKSK